MQHVYFLRRLWRLLGWWLLHWCKGLWHHLPWLLPCWSLLCGWLLCLCFLCGCLLGLCFPLASACCRFLHSISFKFTFFDFIKILSNVHNLAIFLYLIRSSIIWFIAIRSGHLTVFEHDMLFPGLGPFTLREVQENAVHIRIRCTTSNWWSVPKCIRYSYSRSHNGICMHKVQDWLLGVQDQGHSGLSKDRKGKIILNYLLPVLLNNSGVRGRR